MILLSRRRASLFDLSCPGDVEIRMGPPESALFTLSDRLLLLLVDLLFEFFPVRIVLLLLVEWSSFSCTRPRFKCELDVDLADFVAAAYWSSFELPRGEFVVLFCSELSNL